MNHQSIQGLIREAKASSERARVFLGRKGGGPSAELLRDLRVTLEECVKELEKQNG